MSAPNSLPVLHQFAPPAAEDSPVPSSPGSYNKEDLIGDKSQDFGDSVEDLTDEEKRVATISLLNS